MSLILDALKRAERERKEERSAALQDLPAAPAPRGARRRRWRAIGATIAALAIATVLWSVLRAPRQSGSTALEPAVPAETASRPPTPAPEPAVPQQSFPAPQPLLPPARTPPPEPEPEPAPQAAPETPAVVPGTEAVASLDDLTSETLPPEGVPPPAPAAEPGPEMQRAEPPAPEAQVETPAPATETAPAPAAPAPRAERPVPPALTQAVPLRKFREMPPDYRADFPALTVEVHVYERERGLRFVMVNGKRYKEGERLAEGPQLLEIVREGLVLEYRGEKVLYTLGR